MQSQGPTVTSSDASGSTGVPPNQPAREEDSGLHDIRSLATSQRMRNSSKRISTSPPVDDDILAASSAGWKAVALPVAEPVREEMAPLDKKRASRSSKQMAAFVQSAQTAETTEPVSLAAHVALKQNKQKAKSKAPLFAVASLGLAAAAGAAIYVTTQNSADQAPTTIAASSANGSTEPVAKVTPIPGVATATPIEQAPAAQPAAPEAAAAAAPAADSVVASADVSDEKTAGAKDRDSESSTKSSRKGKRSRDEVVAEKTESKKPDLSKTRTLPSGSGAAVVKSTNKVDKNEEPSFEELLKEANIPDNKKVDDKPKLEKKSLSGSDIKKGMSSVAAKAQGCYNGTQGTAAVKLVVDPSGKVSKANVTGAFAGTPVAACVEKAVKAATFPPWDGGPQSFGYSYLLSE